MLGMGSYVSFILLLFLFYSVIPSHCKRRRFPAVSVIEFRRFREIPMVNQKLIFDEIISCITGHDDFSIRGYRAVSLQVSPFLRDCKGRSYRRDRRAGQTELL